MSAGADVSADSPAPPGADHADSRSLLDQYEQYYLEPPPERGCNCYCCLTNRAYYREADAREKRRQRASAEVQDAAVEAADGGRLPPIRSRRRSSNIRSSTRRFGGLSTQDYQEPPARASAQDSQDIHAAQDYQQPSQQC